MKNSIITLLAILMGLTVAAQSLSVGDVYMKASSTNSIRIMISDGINGLASGFYVELPEGFTIEDNATMVYGNHVVKVSHQGGNKERVVVYSTSNASFSYFKFISSMFIYLPVSAGNCKAGQYKGKLTGIEFARTPDSYVSTDDVSFDIIVSGIHGDMTNDGMVDVADVNTMIDMVLGKQPQELITADLDKNGVVDVSDVNALIDIVLGKNDSYTYVVNGVSFKMIPVDGGMFTMGSFEKNDEFFDNAYPAHPVTLFDYAIGETEVTQALWRAVMGRNPSSFAGDLQRPVENVSWTDCQEFITKLNTLTGKSFRLPTEAEWEYAAIGGMKSQGFTYAGSNSIWDVAWFKDNSNEVTHPVGMKLPNELGLYDMTGNVGEWCQDKHSTYSSEPQTNPCVTTYSNRIYRGCSWYDEANESRTIHRDNGAEGIKHNDIGLRLALDL